MQSIEIVKPIVQNEVKNVHVQVLRSTHLANEITTFYFNTQPQGSSFTISAVAFKFGGKLTVNKIVHNLLPNG